MSGSDRTLIMPDRFRDPYIFENIVAMNDAVLNSAGVIDMSRVAFIEPYSMLSFLLMGRNYLRKSGERIRLVNIPLQINQYLTRMDFLSRGVFNVSETIPDSMVLKRSISSSRLLEIVEIPNKERQSVNVIASVIALFRKRAHGILKFWMNEEVVDYFVTVISELCQNIFEHSMDSGFLAMQTYKSGNENIARLVISDSGVGIRKSFEQKSEITYSTGAELIEKALTTPISSKREFGYGLCQVNAITERLKGSVFIRSDSSSLTALYNRKEKSGKNIFLRNDLPQFDGTQISISLSS
ncbi:MAG TPA: ATP-binding protein [Spirochaetota bacterium]|nr:ATP-binding protein [Spirochaetota bacterium]HPF06634.1 ATP-binding protein [Spirochaetota bacterium]HPJ43532.1 ATP-binding protein [Spirochaetota bacterium]HPR36244.1 ATP-binding protein [Spirochaetota bacterium]HRX48107.1 ATP-binding protein [Spirochaetota bacterium]